MIRRLAPYLLVAFAFIVAWALSPTAAMVIVLTGLYFVPVIVAAIRSVPNVGSIAVINFFFGWTFIGWVVALAMASRSQPTQVHVSQQQSQGAGELDEVVTKAIAEYERQKTPESPGP